MASASAFSKLSRRYVLRLHGHDLRVRRDYDHELLYDRYVDAHVHHCEKKTNPNTPEYISEKN